MKSKKWIGLFMILSFLSIGSVGFFNYFIDPFNIFSHRHGLNSLAVDFNERLQKSAYLKYNSTQDYDAVLLGSSRATFYNSTMFKGMKLYNFSFSGSSPLEYNDYLDYAKKNNNRAFKTIILGLDFYTFNNNYQQEALPKIGNKFSFFLKNYFSLDTMKYSIINVKRSLFQTTGHRSYDRENIVHSDAVEVARVRTLSKQRSKLYYASFDDYNRGYAETLESLKVNNKASKFIVYTSPLSKDFLEVIYEDEKLRKLYLMWLESILSVFDEVYCFTVPSEFSENYEQYSIDGDHFYPEVGHIIADVLTNHQNIAGYGVMLNKNNNED
ncbi:MAG: Unknown protein [uncultured Sulfurovum sp.]|uniref:Uncharacterized protein n=1 Tax=uncultured Sulfurovum sp. TaxID=269237 RepID=A0A6S6S9U7_9BACT|nr:MAG: Unknown protein [uncultured Sulfurovum sp.]